MTAVTEIPVETCDLNPTTICKNVNQLVPFLQPVPKCGDFPTQICSYGFSSPRLSERPLVTKWCYNDSDIEPEFRDRKPKLVSLSDHQEASTKIEQVTGGKLLAGKNKQEVMLTPDEVVGGGRGQQKVRLSQLSRSYLPPPAGTELGQATRGADRRGRHTGNLAGATGSILT